MNTTTLTRDEEVTEKEPEEAPALALADEESDEDVMAWVYERGDVAWQDGAAAGVR